jgi:hypothetical protein
MINQLSFIMIMINTLTCQEIVHVSQKFSISKVTGLSTGIHRTSSGLLPGTDRLIPDFLGTWDISSCKVLLRENGNFERT